MTRKDDKIISLGERREQAADRKRAEEQARQAAARRRRLAESGPVASRTGRLIGRVVGLLFLAVLIGSVALWLYSLTGRA